MRHFLVCVVLLLTACKKDAKSEGPSSGSGGAATGSSLASGSSANPAAIDAASPADGSGAAVTAPPSDGSGAAVTAARPKEVAELEAVLVALINEPESEARSRKTCSMEMEIKKKVRAVDMHRPAGVDEAAWEAANHEIASSLDALGPYCADDPPDASVELPKLYKNVRALLTLLPK